MYGPAGAPLENGLGGRPGHPLLIDRREHVEDGDELAAGDPT